MVRSGPAVAAAVALLEQQACTGQGAGLRRAGAVSVLPRRSASTTDSDNDGDSSSPEQSGQPPPLCQSEGNADGGQEPTGRPGSAAAWTDSAHSGSSEEIDSASETDENNRDDHNTTGCDEDFQWVRTCTELAPESEPQEMQDKFNNLYSNTSKDPGKPVAVTYRNKSSSSVRARKERDNKSKSSNVYPRYHSPSRNIYSDDYLRRNMCYNCWTSCQNIPDCGSRYGSSPGLDCHWLSQPLGCYHCHHSSRNYYCDQVTPQYRYFKSSTDSEEVLRRLEADKERLALQVSVLSEQIDAQAEKIVDLEKALDDKKKQIHTAEDVLNREMLTRSSLETQKLELLAMVSELKRQQAALERENCELRDRLADERRRNKPPIMPRTSATSTPNQIASRGMSPSPSPITNNNISPRKITEHHDDINVLHQSPLRAGELQFSSLPRPAPTHTESPRTRVAFGRGPVAGDRSCSVPNLADTEATVINDSVSETDNRSRTPQPSPSPSLQTNRSRGIKKIFGKMKRSGSGSLDELPIDGQFRRGGVRATAGGRLGWSTSPQHNRMEQPMSEWTCEQVCDWLAELGLECVAEYTRWGKTGAELLASTTHDIDKELAIKNPLHRKKLHLALHCARGGAAVVDQWLIAAGALDTAWVLRWLDDAGLPQHKDAFLSARIDGRLLHRLTLDDLNTMHVTSVLHVASIRTGILVLRSQNFEPNCLQRRSSPEGDGELLTQTQSQAQAQVALWTNHRVMEWLRAVDLAEYAPNLRGSGVHGGLMVHEPRFTGELLASLLSIPPAKTLLRRHLLTHFKELLGRDVIQQKREAEASLGYIPLTTTAKMKVPKKTQFTLKRKKAKSELDYGELVCPLRGAADDTQGDASRSPPHGKTKSQEVVSHDKEVNDSSVIKNGPPTPERNTSV